MDLRPLGRTNLSVSPVGFGGGEIAYRDLPADDCARLLNHALNLGINVFDTAECYPGGEEKIGRAIGYRRPEIILCSKVGHAKGFLRVQDWDPRLVRASVDRSLARLGTDHLDILFLHSCELDTLKDAALIDQMVQTRATGKARAIGYAGDGDAALFAVRSGLFDVIQVSLNLADQQALDKLLPESKDRGIGVIIKRALANAAWQPPTPNPGDYRFDYHERLTALELDALTKPNAAELALRFSLHQPGVHCALVGTTLREHLDAAVAAWNAGPIPPRELALIRARWKQVAKPSWVGLT